MGLEDKAFLRATDIFRFIDTYNLTGRAFRNNQSENDSLNVILKDLQSKKKEAEEKEKAFYSILNISPKNLTGLQNKLNEINNNSGLVNFTNKVLRSLDFKESVWNSTELQRHFQKYLSDILQKEVITEEDIGQYLDKNSIIEVTKDFLKYTIEEGRTINKKEKKVRFTKNFINKIETTLKGTATYKGNKSKIDKLLIDSLKNKNSAGSGIIKTIIKNTNYSKDFMLAVTQGKTENEFNTELNYEELIPDIDNLVAAYPYYRLKEDQKEIALGPDGVLIWKNFKHFLFNLLNYNGISFSDFDNIMEQIGIESFIEDSRSQSGVIGLLGEVATGVILCSIFDISGIQMMGDKKITKEINGKNKTVKAPIDVLLTSVEGKFGIQVKNYAGYTSMKEGKVQGHGYQLRSDNLQWSTIREGLENSPNLIQLEKYLSIVGFNKVIKEAKGGPYDLMYSRLTAKQGQYKQPFNTLMAQYYGVFFKQEMEDIFDSNEEAALLRNNFYIFGGKVVIPTSKILDLLYRRIDEFRKNLINVKREGISIENFIATEKYNGIVWRKDWKDVWGKKGENAPTIGDILKNLTVRATMNLYLNDLDLDLVGVVF